MAKKALPLSDEDKELVLTAYESELARRGQSMDMSRFYFGDDPLGSDLFIENFWVTSAELFQTLSSEAQLHWSSIQEHYLGCWSSDGTEVFSLLLEDYENIADWPSTEGRIVLKGIVEDLVKRSLDWSLRDAESGWVKVSDRTFTQ